MQGSQRQLKIYLAAGLLPFLATAIAWGLEELLPRGNVSLVYLTMVLVVAVRSSARPALFCALISFFAYNFFFIEPRFTLFMMHREDVLTASFFLLMAAVTGHLAARLREKILVLETREKLHRVQLGLSKRLASAMVRKEILTALTSALNDAICRLAIVFDMRDAALVFTVDGKLLPSIDVDAIRYVTSANRPAGRLTEIFSNAQYYYVPLTDTKAVVAVIAIIFREDNVSLAEKQTVLELLLQQASTALHRIQLHIDLQKERGEKDQELLRSALLSSVSHDLRTPLAAMIGATTSLLDLGESLSAEQKRELLETTLDESRRLDRYIQNLLDMTRLGYGELRLERDLIPVEDVISVVIKRLRPLLREHKIKTKIQREMPLLNVHSAMIEQALFNILENAVKFSPDGSVIEIHISYAKPLMTIDIIDQGPGIPELERNQIFDMFHTVRRGDRHPAGTGLGLAIAQSAIGAHGGSVAVIDSENHIGATMRIQLPIMKKLV